MLVPSQNVSMFCNHSFTVVRVLLLARAHCCVSILSWQYGPSVSAVFFENVNGVKLDDEDWTQDSLRGLGSAKLRPGHRYGCRAPRALIDVVEPRRHEDRDLVSAI